MGGVAQLLTQIIGPVTSEDQEAKLEMALEAMILHHRVPYQVQLLWFLIKQVHCYYSSNVGYESGLEEDESGLEEEDEDEWDPRRGGSLHEDFSLPGL